MCLHCLQLELLLVHQVELNGLDVGKIQLSSVDVGCLDCVCIFINGYDFTLLIFFCKQKRENATAAAQIQEVVDILSRDTVDDLDIILKIFLRGRHPYLSSGVNRRIECIDLYSFLLVLFLGDFSINIQEWFEGQQMLVLALDAANIRQFGADVGFYAAL